MRFLIILLICFTVACGGNNVTAPTVTLNTAAHERLDVSWEGSLIRADI